MLASPTIEQLENTSEPFSNGCLPVFYSECEHQNILLGNYLISIQKTLLEIGDDILLFVDSVDVS